MMETAGAAISLQSEFEGLIQAIHRGERFTCFGKPIKGNQCGNPLSITTHAKLPILLEDIVGRLKSAGDFETLLEEASSLVMCVRLHQDQATTKFKEWSERVPTRNCKPAHGGGTVEKFSLNTTTELSKDLTPTKSLSKEQKLESTNMVDTERVDQQWSPESPQSSFKTDFDDSGLESSNEEDLFGSQPVASENTRTAAPPSLAEYAAPRTPQKPAKPASTDSGISMSFDTSDEAQTKRSIKYRDEPESPLTGKASRTKRVTTETRPPRPAPTPVQPRSLSILTKKKYVSFNDPLIKLRNYINKPLLGKDDMEEGYIYGFQLEGCAYTKIGCAAGRKGKASLEASFDARMKEHQRSGWRGLKVVLKKKVPHVRRVEKIIHYHLWAGRIKELCLCESWSGGKCDHGSHTEWFNNSLDEIYTVVIAWTHWILSVPYVELHGGRRHLSSEWKSLSRLENIRNQHGHDNWLDWLCQNVPELLEVTNEVTLDTGEWIEDESTDEGHGSFVRSSATGVKVEIKRTKTYRL